MLVGSGFLQGKLLVVFELGLEQSVPLCVVGGNCGEASRWFCSLHPHPSNGVHGHRPPSSSGQHALQLGILVNELMLERAAHVRDPQHI